MSTWGNGGWKDWGTGEWIDNKKKKPMNMLDEEGWTDLSQRREQDEPPREFYTHQKGGGEELERVERLRRDEVGGAPELDDEHQ